MKILKIFLLITVLVLAWSLPGAFAATQITDEGFDGWWRDLDAVVDSNGNLHIAYGWMSFEDSDLNGTSIYPAFYSMVDSDGNVLIDATKLTLGRLYSVSARISIDAENNVYIVYGAATGEMHFTKLSPYDHEMDGTDANATATTPVAGGGNVGNGTMSVGKPAAATALTEDWTVTYNGTDWDVVGSVSGTLDETADTGSVYPGTYSDDPTVGGRPVSFYIEAGGTPFESGDSFTFSTTTSPILNIPDGDVISDGWGLQSTPGVIATEPDGTSHISWQDGSYDESGAVILRRLDSDGTAKEAAFMIDFGFSTEGYGGRDPEVAVDGQGNTHVAFHTQDDGLFYALIDGSSTSKLVGVTPVFDDVENGYIMRPKMAVDNDGVVYLAFQAGRNWDYPATDDWRTESWIVRFNPYAAKATGDPIFEHPTAVAGGSNVGNGTVDNLRQSLGAPTADWTITCTDATTAGEEVWSVSNSLKGAFDDATTGIYYYTDGYELNFLITAGGTDFAVGDEFTFSSENAAYLGPVISVRPGEQTAHPSLSLDRNGSGLHVAVWDSTNADAPPGNYHFHYYHLGYDLEILQGPVEVDNDYDLMESMYLISAVFAPATAKGPAKVHMVWNEDDEMFWEAVIPTVNWPVLTAVDPAEGEAGVTVALTGTGFVDGATVFFGDTESATVTFNSATSMDAEVPAGLADGAYDVKVVNPDTLFSVLADGYTVATGDDDDTTDDDDDTTDDDDTDDDTGDDDEVGDDDDDDDDDDGCCGC